MTLILSIGGIPVRFDMRSREMASRIAARYKGFLRKKVTPLAIIRCRFTKRYTIDDNEVIVSQEDSITWCIHRSDFICTVQEPFGVIEMHRSIYSFDACIRVLFATLLTQRRGLLLHASGVIRKGKGYVFAGVSGSGKTTVARLSKTVGTVINDEIVAIRIHSKSRIEIFGTPFWGEMRTGPAYAVSTRLSALYFLIKDTICYTTRINLDDGLARLLRCTCIFSNGPVDMERIMNLGIALVKAIPVYDLHFEKNPTFWKVIEKEFRKQGVIKVK